MPSSAWGVPGTQANGPILIYVSPSGHDQSLGQTRNLGQPAGPVKSLGRARDIARSLRQKGTATRGIEIVLMEGVYQMSQALSLGPEDSGTPSAPLIFRGETPDRTILSGAIDITGFSKVKDAAILNRLPPSAKGKLWEFNLPPAAGVDGPLLQRRGTGHRIPARMPEIFVDNAELSVSRWPQEGFGILKEVRRENSSTSFQFEGATSDQWLKESALWAAGYWYWNWAFASAPIRALDTQGRFALQEPEPAYGVRNGQRANILNALCDVNRPGLFSVDPKQGKVFFWPLASTPSSVRISWTPCLIQVQGAAWIEFRNLHLIECAATALQFTNVQDCQIRHCTVSGASGRGLDLNGLRCTVSDSDFEDLGEGAILVEGGDLAALTPGSNRIQNCRFSRFTRQARTYAPAINIKGVGHEVSHNLIHDGPHVGILFQGCDHVIEYNELFDLCRESSDSGAIYSGRDWTSLGTVIRYNYFHEIRGVGKVTPVIYLDDQASGTRIEGNLFYKVQEGIFIHAGSGNEIIDNLFVESNPSLTVAGQPEDPALMGQLKALSAKAPRSVYARRYPVYEQLLRDPHPGTPKGNRIEGNAFVLSAAPIFAGNLVAQQNVGINYSGLGAKALARPLTTAPYGPGAFRLSPTSGLPKVLQTLPFEKMGPLPR